MHEVHHEIGANPFVSLVHPWCPWWWTCGSSARRLVVGDAPLRPG